MMLAVSNLGTLYWLPGKHPRKELLEKLYRKHAERIYIDTKDGKTYHTGYIIAGEWWDLYEVIPWRKEPL